ncbi:hypothetical protein D0T84_02645 [Dysgonomonas sp. 521]|uniref:hypothetical protein n=1 Tax=Dysgonomonas sp. 521 TaxID=2302932 RepID=UPI0013D5A83A|nr:hypothetical protein [Dysgonomonas sp. 521]NDV93816.1 hypothetical protein [Dysgonomonas sp. 521]
MDNFEIRKGFRSADDIDKLRVNLDTLSSWDSCLSFLQGNNLKGIIVYSDNESKQSIDFSFLKKMTFLEYFEWLVPLNKNSDITGLYSLSNLKNLRWIVDNRFNLDFSKLTTLQVLITSDYVGMENWDSLTNLKKLYLSKLKKQDCTFISELKELTDLKLSRANITTIKGLESCHKLERLELLYCRQVAELASVIKDCPGIISISIRKCKNISKDEIANLEKLGKSVWFE